MSGLTELIDRVQGADLLRFTTAGSVDDGKSTLIGRLLHDARGLYDDQLSAIGEVSRRNGSETIDWALVTDGLKAEREQRITIDVAYRHFSTPRRRFIIADTPGHEQYTRNMATGASTADLAVILLDATRGAQPQAHRHGCVAALLGIRHLVVAVNKMDLVGWSEATFTALADEYRAWAARLPVDEVTVIPVSALHGDNVVEPSSRLGWYGGPPLLRYLETVAVPDWRRAAAFRFPVQLVLRPTAEFRGYSGRIASGRIHLDDQVLVLPAGRMTRVRRLLGPGGELAVAVAPQSVTLCLADAVDAGRGHLVAAADDPPQTAEAVAANLIWFDETPLTPGRRYLVKHGAELVRVIACRIRARLDPTTLARHEAATLALNDIGEAELEFDRPLLCDAAAHNRATGGFILIDPETDATVAAGLVLSSLATRPTPPGPPPPQRHLTPHRGRVGAAERAALLGQRPACLWLTGLSGAGKSTLAYALEARLIAAGRACVVLDGDNLRQGLCGDLGFSPADRSENIRRVAEVARLFVEAGLIVLTAFISPYREDRATARTIIGAERFAEIFVDAPLTVCEARDPKGLYAKARAGQIPEFTGIGAPYETPEAPAVHLTTDRHELDELVERLVAHLRERGCLAAGETGETR